MANLPKLPPEYSALIIRSDGDRSCLYVRSDRRRVEMEFANGHRHVVIVRGDLGIGWLWQNSDPWVETPIDWRSISADVDPSNELFWREAGAAEIEGELCTRYIGSQCESGTAVQEECFVLRSGIRKRTVTYHPDGSVGIAIDCRNVSIGPPPSELFELPPGASIWRMGRRKGAG